MVFSASSSETQGSQGAGRESSASQGKRRKPASKGTVFISNSSGATPKRSALVTRECPCAPGNHLVWGYRELCAAEYTSLLFFSHSPYHHGERFWEILVSVRCADFQNAKSCWNIVRGTGTHEPSGNKEDRVERCLVGWPGWQFLCQQISRICL